MIMINDRRDECRTTWQQGFIDILPEIERRLRCAFRNLDPESRDDATQQGIVHSLLSYVRLSEQGRVGSVTASSLAWYASLAVKRGRPAGVRMNVRDPLSRYAQLGKGIKVKSLQTYSATSETWIDLVVADKRASVPDQVAVRLDARQWFATLSRRTMRIARDLAHGFSTSEVALKHGVTAGRISQLRRTLEESWLAFQQEAAPALAQ